MQAENDALQPVSASHEARSACISVAVARLSQILAVLFQVPLTARENVALPVLYWSDPALAGLKERL